MDWTVAGVCKASVTIFLIGVVVVVVVAVAVAVVIDSIIVVVVVIVAGVLSLSSEWYLYPTMARIRCNRDQSDISSRFWLFTTIDDGGVVVVVVVVVAHDCFVFVAMGFSSLCFVLDSCPE